VRSNFAAAAVVPVDEQEVTRAREAGGGSSSIPCLVQQRTEPVVTPSAASEAKPSDVPRSVSRGPKTLMQTLKQLAERERWTDPDALSESGVRHLKVEVQERMARRS
jgi:hypothetical protein